MAQSMSLNAAAGLPGMLKSGHTHHEGLDAATLRNIDAAKQLSTIVRSSLGPHGMNKLVINHLEKIIVTSDCATIVRELEIEHPAAKMLVMASTMQDEECGDGTNLTVSFAGQLLTQTEDLLRMGLHCSEIISGYKKAMTKLIDILPKLATSSLKDASSVEELTRVIKPVVMAKQYGSEDVLAPLIAKACIATMSSSPSSEEEEGGGNNNTINVEGVRITKILGGNITQSSVINGMVFLRSVEPTQLPTKISSSSEGSEEEGGIKIVMFGCGIEASSTEAKGTVLMKNADDLKSYNITEETKMEEIIQSIANTGVKLVVSGGSVSEMALHFLEKYKILCLKIGSKWELRRLSRAIGATPLVRLGPPTPEEMGYASSVQVQEIGGRNVTIISTSSGNSRGGKIATILLRASTSSLLADLERAVDDGIHAANVACKHSKGGGLLVPGGGATEMALSKAIGEYGDLTSGLDQYAIRGFAKALEFVPTTLAENSGQDPTDVLAALSAAHAKGQSSTGVDITGDSPHGIIDTSTIDLYDLLDTKMSAFRLSVDAALTVLRVDQIIMARPARGGQTMG